MSNIRSLLIRTANRLQTGRLVTRLLTVCLLSILGTAAHAAPTFNKAFLPNNIGPGSTSSLSFTITNDATPASSLNFTDNFPVGLVIANPANLSNSCEGRVNASAGASQVTLSDGRLAGNQSCVISVNVTSSTLGTLTNTSGDLSSSDGNSGSATADLIVSADRAGFSKSFFPSSIPLGGRSTLTFTIDNSANTQAALSLQFNDNLPGGMVIADPANLTNGCGVGTVSANPGSNMVSYMTPFSPTPALGAGSICTISVDVTATSIGLLLNSSDELMSQGFTGFINSGFAVAELAVNVTTVSLTKKFLNDPVAPGSTVDLNFSIVNRDRRSNADDIAFSDDLNANLSGLSALGLPANGVCGSGSSLSESAGVLSLTGGNLSGGASCDFSVTLQVPANAAAGGYTNLTSAITANLNGSPFTGNMASDTLFVEAGPSLTKTFSSNSVGAGDTVSMEFTVTNNSSASAASDITFSDNLSTFIAGSTPLGLPLTDVCGTGSAVNLFAPNFGDTGIQLIGGNLLVGGSCTFSVDVMIPTSASDGVKTNITSAITATIDDSTRSGNPAQASLSIVSTPSLVKSFTDDPVAPGSSVTLEFTLSTEEEATDTATNISFTDDLEASLSGLVATGLPLSDVCGEGSSISGSSLLTFSGGTLASGESCTFSITLNVPADTVAGNYANQTSTVSATVNGVETTGLGGEDTLIVAGLDVSKSFLQESVIPGGSVTMRWVIDNTNTASNTTAITLTDNLNAFIPGTTVNNTLPENDVCGSGSSLSLIGASLLVLQGGNLLAGESCTIDIDLTVPANTNDGTYNNVTGAITASVGGSTINLAPVNAGLEVSSELIGLTKAFAQDSVSLGTTSSINFEISNLSDSETITDIAFTDDLNATLNGLLASGLPVNDVCGVGSSLTGSSVISLAGGSLAPGATCAFSVNIDLPASAEGVDSITNTTSSTSGLVGGLAVSGAPATDSAIVVNVSYSKAFDSPAIAGESTTLTFSIQNNGSATLDRIFFTDNLEAVVSGLAATGLPSADVCGTGSLLTGSSVITLTGGVLAPGESCQFDVNVAIPSSASGDFLNVTSPLNDEPLDIAPAATAPLRVLQRSASFSKAFSAAADPGSSVTLSFDIENTGTAELSDLNFTDDLEAVLSGLVATGLPVDDVCGTGSTLSGTSTLTLSGGNLLPGTGCQFSVVLDIPADAAAGDFTNTTSALSEAGASLAAAASADLTINAIPSAEFSKSFSAAAEIGGSTTLNFEISNTGAVDLTDLAFTDDLNSVLAGLVASGLPQNGVCGVGSTLTGTSLVSLSGGNLTAGSVCQFSVQVEVPSVAAAGTYTNITSALTESGNSLADAATAVLTVNEMDDDVTICHRWWKFKPRTIVVPRSALKRHLRHGDTIGACPEPEKVKICLYPGYHFQKEKLVERRWADLFIHLGIAKEGSCPDLHARKVTLCHRYIKWHGYYGSYRYKTIRVKPHKVAHHLYHGDRRGACGYY